MAPRERVVVEASSLARALLVRLPTVLTLVVLLEGLVSSDADLRRPSPDGAPLAETEVSEVKLV